MYIYTHTYVGGGLPWWLFTAQAVKNLPANAGDVGLISGSGRSPGERNPVLLVESHGQRRLAGYSPWGCRGSYMT